MKPSSVSPYKGFRFPPEIIGHCVWLYFRFSLSFRDLEEIMAERGISMTYETIRQWCLKFGQQSANILKYRSGKLGNKWHLDWECGPMVFRCKHMIRSGRCQSCR
ncbi:hypothetical protein KSB_59930 [Ktedonobacter robiniae]|uniref:IS6 family transposase n=1 Tax=Ktedonobacter robiniae TaxID=2778365 RepID=A0ABQ3UXX0_9CHLR|nr:hypothetical protein KSB_59930 [Ktedonobacter robiniae]